MQNSNKPRILLYDIENTPIEGAAWGLYEQDLVWVNSDWFMLSYAYKWLGDTRTHVVGLPDFPSYRKDKRDDKELVKSLHKLFNEADIIIAHNGDRFDQRKAQARMIIHDLTPPSHYHQIDTRKVAKKYFMFTSNKLDDLGEYLKVGSKLETGGKYLWKSCMAGEMKAWRKMLRYNKQDVVLLEKVYLKLRPWMDNHPNLSLLANRPGSCPKCGRGPLQARGYRYTRTTMYQRYQCQSCGGWSRSKKSERTSVFFT